MLDEKTIKAIEEILIANRTAELAVRNGKVIVWETRSKKKYEATVTLR